MTTKVQTTNKTFRHSEKALGFAGLLASGSYVNKRFDRSAWEEHKKAVEAKEIRFSGAFDTMALLSGTHGAIARIARLSDCGKAIECIGNAGEIGSVPLSIYDETGGKIALVSLAQFAGDMLKAERIAQRRADREQDDNGRLYGSLANTLATQVVMLNKKIITLDIDTNKANENNKAVRSVVIGEVSESARMSHEELDAKLAEFLANATGGETVKKARSNSKRAAKVKKG